MSEQGSSEVRYNLRAMGFEAGTDVFSSAPRFTIDDLKSAMRHGSRTTILVQLTHVDLVLVAPYQVDVVAEDDPADATADSKSINGWRFDGLVEDESSRFNGQPVRGYIVGVLDANDMTLCRVYAQLIPDNPSPGGEVVCVDDDDPGDVIAVVSFPNRHTCH